MSRNRVEVTCNCGHQFHVAESMKGGLTNCPECNALVEVSSTPEGTFWLVLALMLLIGLSITGSAFAAGGVEAGIITFLICGSVIGEILMSL